jgi:2-succinyl-5-enolpyruvyl-6-hydroxy-3-cyclohexene-1-carboxylate synthase
MNSALAQKTLLTLARLGVREVCVAAGARNVPLITAFLASDGLKIWNFFEERSAGFFALGRMLVTGQPVAVLTTSGTAVAELLPAVIEAYYQGQPLIVLSADRPSSYRGSGAPQAIEQVGIFGMYAEQTVEVEAGADIHWPTVLGRRPIHINVCFNEPLLGETKGADFNGWDGLTGAVMHPRLMDAATHETLKRFVQERAGLLIMVGGLLPQEAKMVKLVLERLQLPIMAEATAQLHDSEVLRPWLVRGGDAALRALNCTRIIRIGGVPSWRWWRDLENQPEVQVLHFSRNRFSGLARDNDVTTMPLHWIKELPLLMQGGANPDFSATNAEMQSKLLQCTQLQPLSEVAWMRHLAAQVTAESNVFLGNSLPVREWNLAVTELAKEVQVWANRGANGIDGLLSTALGVMAEAEEGWVLLGDLSAMYDLSAPWVLNQLQQSSRLRIVIINNAGGKIFSRVESLKKLSDKARQVVENQHTISFKGWASMWGLSYRLARQPSDLWQLPDETVVIEVQPDTAQSQAFWDAWQGVQK